jgi:predicted O-linked N-acetylglucosamine transferase (SPINDLY family)
MILTRPPPAPARRTPSGLPRVETTLQEAALLFQQNRLDVARRLYRTVLQTSPDNFDALHYLGLIELRLGKAKEAADLFRRALRRRPNSAMACNSLGLALQRLARYAEAMTWYEKALTIEPRYANAHYNLGNLLKELKRYEDAVESYERALALKPDLVQASLGLAGILVELWRDDEAIAQYNKALAIQPDLSSGRSSVLCLLNYRAQETPATLFEAHRVWAELHAPAIASLDLRFTRSADPDRRLRVGYVSPDFRNHPAADFVAPVIEAHDRRQFEIVCYSDVARPDEFTKHLMTKVERWVTIHGKDDADVAKRIRNDGIDILIEAAGHFADNRLPLYAAKPAPVQVGRWLGYPNTTGLTAIDYRITDAVLDPEGADRFYSEELIRIPYCFCWRTRFEAGPVQSPPVKRTGHITFGSFNKLNKMTPEVVKVWARLLVTVPSSRLLLVASALANPSVGERVARLFADAGVDRDRLVLSPTVPPPDHLALYNQVDIALDPFPYNGNTTSCEALWMGVPIVTLSGDRHASRVGVRLLTLIDLPELIAETEDAYVAIAASLARGVERLEALRADMRERLRTSPVCDIDAITRAVETAYRDAWRRWCEKFKGAGTAPPRGRTKTS